LTKSITVDFEEEEFEKLKEFKERMGLTWRGVVLWGIEDV